VTAPFKSKKEANEWEKKKADELQVKTVKQKIDTTRIRVEWRGFYFEHDGRK
jgi:CYTH domain-containing protein